MEPKRFFVADLKPNGELHAQAEYLYEQLERVPGASDLIGQFSASLYRTPEEFDTQISWANGLTFRWRASAQTAGIATLRANTEVASVSLLCTGLNADADRLTLEAFQKHLLHELHDTGFEPAFGLMELTARPLVATLNFHSPPDPRDQIVAALADRCFAASYFRYHHLA